MRVNIWLLVALATTMTGCAGGNAATEEEGEWAEEAAEDCGDVSPILCLYVTEREAALTALADAADDAATDVSEGMPAALQRRAELAIEFAIVLQDYAAPTDENLGLASASRDVLADCVEMCIKSEQDELMKRVSDQAAGGNTREFLEEMRPSLELACEPGRGSKAHKTESCLARLNPAQKARTWLMNDADDRYRLPFKKLIRSIAPVQQLVLFKVEMGMSFASMPDAELDAMHAALMASQATATKFIRLVDRQDRAMPLRALDPVDQWRRSVSDIDDMLETARKKCGSGCSPAWRAAAGQ
jgi:hypothetical protein